MGRSEFCARRTLECVNSLKESSARSAKIFQPSCDLGYERISLAESRPNVARRHLAEGV
jgi:hypothetical protein